MPNSFSNDRRLSSLMSRKNQSSNFLRASFVTGLLPVHGRQSVCRLLAPERERSFRGLRFATFLQSSARACQWRLEMRSEELSVGKECVSKCKNLVVSLQ